MSRILRRRAARQDLVDIFRHYAREAGLTTAHRFHQQAEDTFQQLARMPGMGARYECEHPTLAELRFFPISRFKKYLVFYLPMADGIAVLRVLHGARDVPSILATEFDIEENADDDPAEGEDK
jgi:toxin ParE1/3/4